MSLEVTAPGMSWPRRIGALCGALAILLGSVVLVGWAIRFTFVIQVPPNLPSMQPSTAVGLALSGFALLGIVIVRPRFTFVGSAIAATVAMSSLLERFFHVNIGIDQLLGAANVSIRMSPATTVCFLALAMGCVC